MHFFFTRAEGTCFLNIDHFSSLLSDINFTAVSVDIFNRKQIILISQGFVPFSLGFQ